MNSKLIQAAQQRVDAADAFNLKDLKPISTAPLYKGAVAKKYGVNVGNSVYAFRVKLKHEDKPVTIFGIFEGGHPGDDGKFGQLTRSEWNSTFRDLWSRSRPSYIMEFLACQDGTVFFYVYK